MFNVKLKKDIGGQQLRNLEEVKIAIFKWLCSAGADVYASGIEKLVDHSRRFLQSLEDYVKKVHLHCMFL